MSWLTRQGRKPTSAIRLLTYAWLNDAPCDKSDRAASDPNGSKMQERCHTPVWVHYYAPVRGLSSRADGRSCRQVRVPLLFVVADKDRALAEAQRLSQAVPNAQLVILPGEDHFKALPAQTYKEAVASFLKEHSFSAA